jgi:hypothetical protein
MKYEVIFLATDSFTVESLIASEQFYDIFLFTDEKGYISLESANFESIN